MQQQVKCHHLAAAKSGQESESKYGAGQKRWRGREGQKVEMQNRLKQQVSLKPAQIDCCRAQTTKYVQPGDLEKPEHLIAEILTSLQNYDPMVAEIDGIGSDNLVLQYDPKHPLTQI